MRNVKAIKDHPSAKVLTLEIDQDLLGHYAKIAIPRGSRITDYSPFAKVLFERGKDVNRVDFFAKDGNTCISIARKFMGWDEKSAAAATALTEKFLATNHPVIYLEALSTNFTSHAAFDHGGHPVKKLVQKTFLEQVNPMLAKDGGAMELLRVEMKPTGEISSDVALLGSCNSCTSAHDTTLRLAADRIRQVLEIVKKQYADNPSIAALKFTGIRISNMEEIILSR